MCYTAAGAFHRQQCTVTPIMRYVEHDTTTPKTMKIRLKLKSQLLTGKNWYKIGVGIFKMRERLPLCRYHSYMNEN